MREEIGIAFLPAHSDNMEMNTQQNPHFQCIVCDKYLEPCYPEEERYSPVIGGLHFATSGAYGTTVFDPMDGSSIEVAVCDECLKKKWPQVRHNPPDTPDTPEQLEARKLLNEVFGHKSKEAKV